MAEKEAFLPGMSVTAEIETRYRSNVLSVPIQSVTTRLPIGTNNPAQTNALAAKAATNSASTTNVASTNSAASTNIASGTNAASQKKLTNRPNRSKWFSWSRGITSR